MPKTPPDGETITVKLSKAPATMKDIGGSEQDAFNRQVYADVAETVWKPLSWSKERRDQRLVAAALALRGFKPSDEIEGMLAAQAIAMHAASMECSRRAMLENQPFDAAQGFRKAAVTASRAFIELTAALDRKRGKGGKQTVRVEHVHIHPGGQAVVGHITTQAMPGEGGRKPEEEPHAPPTALGHDPASGAGVTSLWCQDPERVPVPVSSDAERSVQDARRSQFRASRRRRD